MINEKNRKSLKICFMGGSQAGIIGALAILSKGHRLIGAVSYYDKLTEILNFLGVPLYSTVHDRNFVKALGDADILVCVHGREILNSGQLGLPKLGCINVHPYLYKYKGAYPVERALKDKNFKGSVGVHKMEEEVDKGKVIIEEFVDIKGAITIDGIYNSLYPYYAISLLKALDIITGD